MEAFENLTDNVIKEIIPKVGPRILFRKKYFNYKKCMKRSESPLDNDYDKSCVTDRSLPTPDVISSPSTSISRGSPSSLYLHSPMSSEIIEDLSPSVNPWPDAIVGMTENEIAQTPGARHRRKLQEECAIKTDIENVLNKNSMGKIILGYYAKNNKLEDNLRDKLAQIIIENEIKDNLDQRISIERFELLSNAIVFVFPTEIKELYFSISFCKNNNRTWSKIGCGKLYRKFYNCRRILRQSGLLAPVSRLRHTEEGRHTTENGSDEKLRWLQNSIEPWSDVIEQWQRTFETRAQYRESLSIMEYMEKFPALKLKMGYTLLQRDFIKMYPELEMKFFSNFPNFAQRILNYAKTLKSKEITNYIKNFEEEMSTDVFSCQILFLLPLLLRPVVVKNSKKSSFWKPSKIEMTEGFILHVKIPGEIQASLERKQNKLARFGLTLQPTPIIVGENFGSIIQCFVSIDNVLYEVPTVLKAVDVTFSAIHALNACYSKEAEQVWLLVQKGIYEYNSKYDKKFASLEQLLHAINV